MIAANDMGNPDPSDKVINELLAFSQALLAGDYTKRIITEVNDTPLSQISINLNKYADRRQVDPGESTDEMEQMIMDFIDVISSYANRDFSKKLRMSGHGTLMDAIGTGINILGEELEHTTVSRNELETEKNNLKVEKEKALEANRLKTIFIGNLSHEVRTPLQGILGFAELLEVSELSEDKKLVYLRIIKQRVQDLQNIIESLLDLASIESGEIKSFPTHINLGGTVQDIFESFRQEYSLHESRVTLQFENSIPQGDLAYVDPVHLKRVINNLLQNSMKFTTEGGIVLACAKGRSDYLIKIQDSGIGIDAQKRQLIFEPFRQAHEGISRSKGGIGLGLPICKKMVEMWGGEITLESEAGKGSTFSFSIPYNGKKDPNRHFLSILP